MSPDPTTISSAMCKIVPSATESTNVLIATLGIP